MTDGYSGYRRSVKDMNDAREQLRRAEAVSASLRIELQAAYVGKNAAERESTNRLGELNSMRSVLQRVQAEIREERKQAKSVAAARAAISAADALAQAKRLPPNAQISGLAVDAGVEGQEAIPGVPSVTFFTSDGDGDGEGGGRGDGLSLIHI